MGKAATHPPALAILSHTPPGTKRTIAWVGKGIVYDTGALSLKDKVTIPCLDLGYVRICVCNDFNSICHYFPYISMVVLVYCLMEQSVYVETKLS